MGNAIIYIDQHYYMEMKGKIPKMKQPKQKDKKHCMKVGFNNEIEIIFFYITRSFFFFRIPLCDGGATVDTVINQWVI